MSDDELLGMEIFDEEKSREVVIDFVQTNPDCIAEDILRGQKQVGRKKLFRILPELKKEKIIIEGKKSKLNARNIKLFVNGANPVTVVLNELKKFEKIYSSILEKTADACNNGRYLGDLEQTSKHSPEVDFLFTKLSGMALMWQPLHIFVEFLKTYITRLITIWSKVIQDKHVIDELNSMIFTRFARMQARMYKIMTSKISEEMSSVSIKTYTHMQTNMTEQLKKHVHNLEKYGMEKEAKELLDFVEGIVLSDNIKSYFRDKNKPYRWDLKYKAEDIKTLAEDMYRHRDDIDVAYYDSR